MPDARLGQASFTSGELTPELHGRRDLAKRQVGVRKMLNCAVSAKGGAFNRAGLRFAGEVKNHNQSNRLGVFEAAADDAYLLVFGDRNVRPMFEGAYVDNLGVPYEIATPWLHTQLRDIYSEQSNDVMTLVHPNYGVRELARYDTLDWRITPVTFVTDVMPPNPLTVTGTAGYLGYGADKLPLFHTYKVSAISASGEESLPSNPYVSDIALVLGYDQNFVTITWSPVGVEVVGMGEPTGALGTANETQFSRSFSLTTGKTVTHVGVWSQSPVVGMKVKIATRTGANAYTVNVTQTFDHPGGGWYDLLLSAPYLVPAGDNYVGVWSPDAIRETDAVTQAWKAGDLGLGAHVAVAEAAGSSASLRARYQSTTAQEVSSYIVYKEQNGLYGYIGETPNLTFKDTNFQPSFANGPQTGANPFDSQGNFPRVVTFSQQRRVFANTGNRPQTTWLTQSGNFKNMGAATPIKDSDAFDFTIASTKKQDIYHIVPLEKGMIVFTRSGEWRVTGRDGDVITPSSVLPTPQSQYGAAKYLRPIVAGEQILFVQRAAKKILEMEYSLEVDRYRANDLTVLAEHLFKGRTVVSWAHATDPDGIVWCVMSDGKVVSLTYLKEHDVWGFGRHETKGKFLDVAVVPEADRDVPYFIVQRRIGGARKQYIEYLAERDTTDVRNCFFVDSGLSYDSPVTVSNVTPGPATGVFVVAHGLATDDVVELEGVDLYDESDEFLRTLDGRWIVTVTGPNNFNLRWEYDNEEEGASAGDDLDTSAYLGTSYPSTDGVFRKGAHEFSGFDHLAGRAISVLADGAVIEGVTVDALGEFTLDGQYCRVHAGLPYVSQIDTLDIVNTQGDDTGITKAIEQAFLRILDTSGIKIGWIGETALELQTRDYEGYGEAASLRSGLFPIDVFGEWKSDNGISIIQEYPLPMFILQLTTEQQYGGS